MMAWMKALLAAGRTSPLEVRHGTAYETASSSTSHSVDMPDGSGGELLLTICTNGNVTVDTPSGWDLLFNEIAANPTAGQNRRMVAFTRTADGSEGASVAVTMSSTTPNGIIYRVNNAAGSFSAATSIGNSANSDPPNLDKVSPDETAWIVACSRRSTSRVSAAPSGYGDLQEALSGTNQVGGWAHKIATLSSDDPGVFTAAGSDHWVAATFGIR